MNGTAFLLGACFNLSINISGHGHAEYAVLVGHEDKGLFSPKQPLPQLNVQLNFPAMVVFCHDKEWPAGIYVFQAAHKELDGTMADVGAPLKVQLRTCSILQQDGQFQC